jgi:anaerobic C4-dicarboxylate transporter DcuA
MVCIPSTIIGVLVGVLFVMKRGKELNEDPEFLEKMKDPAFAAAIEGSAANAGAPIKKGAVKSVILFGLGVLAVVIMGAFPEVLPNFSGVENFKPGFAVSESGKVQMPSMIMIVMLAVVGLIILFANTKASDVTKASLFSSGGQATISVFGVVWMSGTFMNHNFELIEQTLGGIVASYPWLFALALFTLSILLFSQAATAKALMPLGLVLGLSPAYLIAIFPSVNGHFFIPGYPTLLTAIQFDRTGTTRIGKYVINHSFMLPGIITAAAAVGAGLLINSFIN